MALVQCLFFTAANINYTVVIRHIPPTPCLPITIKIMSQMKSMLRERLDLSNDNRQMYWATFGFIRSSEFTAPSPSSCDKDRKLLHPNLTTDDKEYQLHIKASKTDPFCLDVDSFIRRTHHSVCAVKALKNYMACPRASDLPQFAHADGSYLFNLMVSGCTPAPWYTRSLLALFRVACHLGEGPCSGQSWPNITYECISTQVATSTRLTTLTQASCLMYVIKRNRFCDGVLSLQRQLR